MEFIFNLEITRQDIGVQIAGNQMMESPKTSRETDGSYLMDSHELAAHTVCLLGEEQRVQGVRSQNEIGT